MDEEIKSIKKSVKRNVELFDVARKWKDLGFMNILIFHSVILKAF